MDNNELLQNEQPIIEKITAQDLDKANTLTKEEFIDKFELLLDVEEQLERKEKALKTDDLQLDTKFDLSQVNSAEDIKKICNKFNITLLWC